MSRVLVITTSLRAKSNSDILAEQMIAGAKDAGHSVDVISLKGKTIGFCRGCYVCQETKRCVQSDDAVWIAEKIRCADTIVFVTPIYYFEMSGQMKTLLDRMEPLFPDNYGFRRIYMLSAAQEEDPSTPERAEAGLRGWIECFEEARLEGTLFCGGVNDPAEVGQKKEALARAYQFGRELL